MTIKPNFSAFRISSKGMSIQKQQMDVITENIANTSTTRTEDGTPYKRKYISVEFEKNNFKNARQSDNLKIGFLSNNNSHINQNKYASNSVDDINFSANELTDNSDGELVYMPDHPDADDDGYVSMPNVNIVTEMVDMISASRSFEANLTAFNAAKQIAKDSLEI